MLIKIYFWRFFWQINISLGNELSPTVCQAIIGTNVDLDFSHHMGTNRPQWVKDNVTKI